MDRKLLRGDIKDLGASLLTDQLGFLIKTGLRLQRWGIKKNTDQKSKMREDLAQFFVLFLLKLC